MSFMSMVIKWIFFESSDNSTLKSFVVKEPQASEVMMPNSLSAHLLLDGSSGST
jgi:hypothetical protein